MPTLTTPTTQRQTRHTAKSGAPTDALETVSYLRRTLGLTAADIAMATGANERTVRRWLSGDVSPQARYEKRIDDLRAIVEELADSLTPKGVGQWLRGRNRHLKGARPIEMLGRDEFDAVYKAALAFSEGYYI